MGVVPAPYELAFRVAVGAVLAIAPSLLFVGFWRGLQRIRDDQLVEKVLDDADFDERGFAYGRGQTRLDPQAFGEGVADGGDGGTKKRLAPCTSCGTLKPVRAECPVCDGE